MVGLVACGVGAAVVACGSSATKPVESATGEKLKTSGVVEIELPKYQAELPAGEGREAFAAACISCHSTRYITMQPKVSAAKWEESVRKMMKTYGAPVSEQQVPVIVKYLMATKEAGAGAGAGSWEVLAVKPGNAKVPAVTMTEDADVLKRGAAAYAVNCASCHGTNGAGDGLSAKTLLPRPTDLTGRRYDIGALAEAVYRGVPGTAMPGYAKLSAEDFRAVVVFTRGLGAKGKGAAVKQSEAGAKVYAQNCAECHGREGKGDGDAAATAARRPANFQMTQPTTEQATKAITEGVAGTTMPQWGAKLSEDERNAAAEYVRGFWRE
jgi:mono/diheme cytochrome c family protein